MKVVLFDIDGTLILSGGAGLRALRHVFRDQHGLENATEDIEFHGHTDPLILDAIARRHLGRPLEADEETRACSAYLDRLETFLGNPEFRVLEGARDLLDELAGRPDFVLGLATGNLEAGAWAKLRQGDLDGYFAFGGFGSDSEDRRELTRLAVQRGRDRAGADADVVVVGDTVHDVRAADAAGVDCLAVATGNATEAELATAGARWTVPSLADPGVRRVLALSGGN